MLSLDLSTLGLGFLVINESENLLPNQRKLEYVVSLNLSMNVMRVIGANFLGKFPSLQALDLSRNCLTSLEDKHRLTFHDLHSLNLSYNLITSVHPFTFSNLSLDTVDLSFNRLIRFCVADYEIHQLFIANNRLSQVDIDSSHFKELKLLNASNNQIRVFRTANVDFNNLILANNQLTSNDDYFSIRNVYGTLDLSRNHIGEFDWKLISCVTNLNLAFNRLSMLNFNCPIRRYGFGFGFQKMMRLNLNNNHFCSFQQFVSNLTSCLPNLQYISLKGNFMNSKEKEATKKILQKFHIKSQIFPYEFFPELDDDDVEGDFSIFI
jgi:Leucine-rich repeat (LRR) protein